MVASRNSPENRNYGNPYQPAKAVNGRGASINVRRRVKLSFTLFASPLVLCGSVRVIGYWVHVLRTPQEFHGGTGALWGFLLIGVGFTLGVLAIAGVLAVSFFQYGAKDTVASIFSGRKENQDEDRSNGTEVVSG